MEPDMRPASPDRETVFALTGQWIFVVLDETEPTAMPPCGGEPLTVTPGFADTLRRTGVSMRNVEIGHYE